MAKKKTRTITIDAAAYRWLVRPNNGYNVFVAEKEGIKGSRIEVYFDTDINKMWVEFPYTDGLNLKVVKPKDVELIIRQALQAGWEPEVKSAPLFYDLKEDKLSKRKV